MKRRRALAVDRFPNPTVTYSLEALRDAVTDPDGWFAGTARSTGARLDTTVGGPHRPVTGARALLAWAAAGAVSYDQVAHWASAGMDAAEAAAWSQVHLEGHPKTPPVDGTVRPEPAPWPVEDQIDWFTHFGGGKKRRQRAARLRRLGLTARQAGLWEEVVGLNDAEAKTVVETFERAGWKPSDVPTVSEALAQALARNRDHPDHPDPNVGWRPWSTPTSPMVAAWAFLPADRACAYLAAGMGSREVRRLEEAGQPVDAAALAMMAAFLPEPEPVF